VSNNKESHMKKTTILIIAAFSAFSAGAQIQTLVTGTNDLNANSAVVTVPSSSYVQFINASLESDYHIAVTIQGVSFDFDPDNLPLINGDTFTGPATIQVHGDNFNPHFVTLNVVPLRKAVGTNIQTVVAGALDIPNSTINISSNSVATIRTAVTQSSANLLVTVQGVSFSYSLQDVSINGLTFTGPATIQFQGGSFAASYATVETRPLRKSSKTQIDTLVVTPANTNSPTINVPTNSYATITGVDDNFDGTLLPIVNGVPLAYRPDEDKVVGFTFAGPASIQFQGDGFNPGFITVTTTRK
jgi:hypothetical protein